MDVVDAGQSFSCMEKAVCFVGHTHVPKIFVQAGKAVYALPVQDIELDKRHKYIVNVGSVGQPRDGLPLAAYGIYDTEAGSIGVHRIRYDVAGAQRKIRAAGLPEDLAQRLELGR
jgi:diadenosine tetraphosphatase ApaH/serine/threonine PP2A family protein phosphatase